jgi:hypothetical protein
MAIEAEDAPPGKRSLGDDVFFAALACSRGDLLDMKGDAVNDGIGRRRREGEGCREEGSDGKGLGGELDAQRTQFAVLLDLEVEGRRRGAAGAG